jgi:transketolase
MPAVHCSTVLYPSEATSTVELVQAMSRQSGVVYMRTTRGAYPVLYGSGETLPIGGSKVLRRSGTDQVPLIGAGVMLHACLDAADHLTAQGIAPRVIELYSDKPIDADTVAQAAADTQGNVVVAEDHYAESGLGSVVLESTCRNRHNRPTTRAAGRTRPSWIRTAEALLDPAGMSASHIAAAARKLVEGH